MKKKIVLYIVLGITLVGILLQIDFYKETKKDIYVNEKSGTSASLYVGINQKKKRERYRNSRNEKSVGMLEEDKTYLRFKDFVIDYPENILEHLSQGENSQISFN